VFLQLRAMKPDLRGILFSGNPGEADLAASLDTPELRPVRVKPFTRRELLDAVRGKLETIPQQGLKKGA